MEPVFRLLVCSFPHIPMKAKEEWDESVRESFRFAKKSKKIVRMEVPAHVRKRTISDIAAHDEEHTHEKPSVARRRAPTLGAMGGFDLAKFRKMREDRRARERTDQAKVSSVVESESTSEESLSETETETEEDPPSTGSSRAYLI
ncbi:hypothetical protein OESDEN_02661 [Oesophagostomum dentatum]|uniref:Uncharacterized protein n=1 Tax=Oesophagostomum dentatum TaxID=61180 RepID=A0A0B1TJB7_OESDE|nr:hypothetical protein OESDEN_02661 [Oesophagostomum dentatum]